LAIRVGGISHSRRSRPAPWVRERRKDARRAEFFPAIRRAVLICISALEADARDGALS
jgi:hypothetical protein